MPSYFAPEENVLKCKCLSQLNFFFAYTVRKRISVLFFLLVKGDERKEEMKEGRK